ncbi:MAG TPA: GNAT family N-acetyltransferase [Candidatus Baltobacteraceae bacterium]
MRTALLWGYTHHVHAISQFVNEHASHWRLIPRGGGRAARNRTLALLPFVDAVVEFGGPAPDALLAACARRLHKPIGVVWAGSDVLRVREKPAEIARVRARHYRHVACSATLAAELLELGIAASELRLAVATPPETLPPLPEKFSVLGYGPMSKEWLYGTDILLAVAERMPHVRFDIIGETTHRESTLKNVVYHGWLDDVNPAVDAATVIVRPTRHDGMPLMVIEALARGRYVIWSREMAGALYGMTVEAIVDHLTRLEEQHRAGELSLNHDGVRAVREQFDPAAITAGVETFLDDLTARPRKRVDPRKRAVVSGEPEIVAAFLERARFEAPDWHIHSVIGRSRSERLDDVLAMAVSKRWFNLGDSRLDPIVRTVAHLLGKNPIAAGFEVARSLNVSLRPRRRGRGNHRIKLSPAEWRAFDACHPAPTFFARPAWGLALERVYPRFAAEPTLFNLAEGEAIFPLMHSNGRFTSYEAMPLGTYALPLLPDGRPADAKMAQAIVHDIVAQDADEFSCAFWPLAGYSEFGLGETRAYQTSVIDLSEGADAAVARFKGVARRMAGQAVRKGVSVSCESGAIETYYGLLEDSARRWGRGAPHIPLKLFQAVVELGGDDVEVWIARYRGEAIAGGVMLYGSTEAFFWSAALRAEFADLRPSNLLNVQMIRAAADRGIRWYNMGASEGLSGVARFKESLGAEPVDYTALLWQSPAYRRYLRLRSLWRGNAVQAAVL